MSFFRFVIYFAALTACAIVAFPYWAPADTEQNVVTAESETFYATEFTPPKKAPVRYRAPQTARIASRD